MALLGGSLFNPELMTEHPITITPVYDIADDNPLVISESVSPTVLENYKDTDFTPDPNDTIKPPKDLRGDVARVGISQRLATEAYDISWPKQAGAKTYRLFASMSPTNKLNMIQKDIKGTSTRFFVPYFSEVVAYFFWVVSVNDEGKETYITDIPSSLMASVEKSAFFPNPIVDDPKFYPAANELNHELVNILEYIRSGDRLELGINGEPAFLYLRRHAEDRPWGIPCSCTDKDDSDPDYQGRGNCKLCFGTGIFGGFLPKISISIRYGNAPEQAFVHTKRGFELKHAFNTYMLWLPTVRVGDIVVRGVDGSRYQVTKVSPDISTRGVRLHQEFDLQQIEKQDILMEVTDQAIQFSLEKAALPEFLRSGYKSFG